MAHTLSELKSALWAAADEMRKVMSADIYKDYLLGLVFYKAISDKMLTEAYNLINDKDPESIEEAQKAYLEAFKDEETWEDLRSELRARFGCAIAPSKTFAAFYDQINNRTFMLEKLKQAFRDIEAAGNNTYAGLFDDFDVQSKDLGKTPDKRNEMIASAINPKSRLHALTVPRDPESRR